MLYYNKEYEDLLMRISSVMKSNLCNMAIDTPGGIKNYLEHNAPGWLKIEAKYSLLDLISYVSRDNKEIDTYVFFKDLSGKRIY
jgi:hypothetical protein